MALMRDDGAAAAVAQDMGSPFMIQKMTSSYLLRALSTAAKLMRQYPDRTESSRSRVTSASFYRSRMCARRIMWYEV